MESILVKRRGVGALKASDFQFHVSEECALSKKVGDMRVLNGNDQELEIRQSHGK